MVVKREFTRKGNESFDIVVFLRFQVAVERQFVTHGMFT